MSLCSVCHVEVLSWCSSSSSLDGYICINGHLVNISSRLTVCFIFVVVIDPTTCQATQVTAFTDFHALLQFLVNLPHGTIVAVLIGGSCRVTGELVTGLPKLGVLPSNDLQIRSFVQLAVVLMFQLPVLRIRK